MFDKSGKYRYRLRRIWDESKPLVAFIMLNPSTADASANDPTIRRCIRFAHDWGYGGMIAVNLFAYRATLPRTLKRARRPVGPENDDYLLQTHEDAALTVFAWGVHGVWRERDREVIDLLGEGFCLGVTKDGIPRHPLYLRKTCAPSPFSSP